IPTCITGGGRGSLVHNEVREQRECRRSVGTRKRYDLDRSRRQILHQPVRLELDETARLNVILENRIVSGIVSNDHTLRRVSGTTVTHKTDLTTHFVFSVVHKDNSRPPTRAIGKLRNDNRLINCSGDVGDWDDTQE